MKLEARFYLSILLVNFWEKSLYDPLVSYENEIKSNLRETAGKLNPLYISRKSKCFALPSIFIHLSIQNTANANYIFENWD